MKPLRDMLPRRLSTPLYEIHNHVAIRSGADDPVRERRKRRQQDREPLLKPGLPKEVVNLVGHAHPLTTTNVTNFVVVANASAGTATASCPAGMIVTGGGASHNGTPTAVYLTESYPSSLTSWTASLSNQTGVVMTLTVYAQCMEGPIA